MECQNNCHRYSKTIDEIYEAGNKHREKLIALKDITENQKIKICSLREDNNFHLDKIDQLEYDARRDSDSIRKNDPRTKGP